MNSVRGKVRAKAHVREFLADTLTPLRGVPMAAGLLRAVALAKKLQASHPERLNLLSAEPPQDQGQEVRHGS